MIVYQTTRTAPDSRIAASRGVMIHRRTMIAIVTGLFSATSLGSLRPFAEPQSAKRAVYVELVPGGDGTPLQVTLREDETLITEIEDLGVFGFEPRFRKGNDAIVLIVIFDAETSPPILLGAVEVPVNGKRVDSATSPRFGLRIVRIVRAR